MKPSNTRPGDPKSAWVECYLRSEPADSERMTAAWKSYPEVNFQPFNGAGQKSASRRSLLISLKPFLAGV